MESVRPSWHSRVWTVAFIVLGVFALLLTTTGVDGARAGRAVAAVAAVFTVTVVGWAFARTRAQRRRYEEELAAWAAERAAQTERLRIAADLHDLVSHGLGLITVRAAAARSLRGPAGEAERSSALTDIERTSRETTVELRRMLGVLRTPGAAPLRPAETLADLPAIVAAANAAGLTASLSLGEVGDVSAGTQLTVCAVVREALNNTVRHAGPVRSRVSVAREAASIVVDVEDSGPRDGWRPQPGAGHGLDALRARVATLGGTLHTGRLAGRFRLTARIPDRESP
ncbi:sensor histidine kinase [Actinoplanes sp. NPDC020271]|uniref:sensor histidine kinase n=1 Tax=Actinoplanes sp. NPDC020271 TaxID=3363896 RepID=UPI0037909EC2